MNNREELMALTPIFKALSNEHRLQMLMWLKNPSEHFLDAESSLCPADFAGGVCVGLIAKKSRLAQSVVSSYLDTLKHAGLVESRRVGRWTYYRYHHQGAEALMLKIGAFI